MGFLSTYPAWSIFVLTFLLRASLVLSVGPLVPEATDKLNRYDHIAFALMRGQGFSLDGTPTAVAGPVYPVLLSIIYLLFGYSATAVRLSLALLDAVHCVLFYSTTMMCFGHKVAALTALALILSPFTIYAILTMSPEIPFLVFHALFIWVMVFALRTGASRHFLTSGMALGAAALSRAVPIFLPVFLVPLFVLGSAPLKRKLLHFSMFLLGFTVLTVPWIARNYAVFQTFIPIQTLGGRHLYLAVTAADREERLKDRAALQDLDPIEQDQSYYARSWRRIRENPGQYLGSMGQRLLEMWYRTDSRRFETPLLYANSVLLLLAAAGMILTRTRWREHLLFYLVIAYYISLHVVVIALLRYTLPIISVLTAFAMVPISHLLTSVVTGSRMRASSS